MKIRFRIAAILAMSLGLAIPVFSQSTTGAIVGTVADPSGAAVPGVRIAAIEERTNFREQSVSGEDGGYAFPSLRPGQYRIETEAQGFRKLVRGGIELRINDRLRVDLELQIGAMTESVQVTAAAPLVESESGAVGAVIENRKIVNLPLNARNPFQLASLSPGVVPGSNFGDAFNTSANLIINGNRGNTSEIMIDGITNSVPAANPIVVVAMFPSPDALEEFKVQTNGYAAEFGRSGGGMINMVIKSGTNGFHGAIYEFLRNSRMDANNFFSNRQGQSIGVFKRNQFGASVGGPIIRDKAFFFVNYEGLRERSRSQMTGTVPTERERVGDFSSSGAVLAGRCTPIQIFDPFTTRANPAGGSIRDAFPGGVIPASRQDAVGRRLVDYYPKPTSAGAECTAINNFFSSRTQPLDANQMDLKFDWWASAANKLTLGAAWRTRTAFEPNHYDNIAATGIVNGDHMPSQGIRLEYNRTHSPSFLLQGRFGITRLERYHDPNVEEGFSLTDLGFPAALANAAQAPVGFPVVTAAGYMGLGKGSQHLIQAGTSYTWTGSATKISGGHTLKAGIDYRINQSAESVGIDTSGRYGFNRNFTQGPNPNQPAADRGNAIAGMLLGVVSSGQIGVLPAVFTSNPYMGLYLQDDWRVSRRLTLNVGLRYELEKGRSERYNRLSYFDFDAPSPVAQQVGIPSLRGGLRFVGADGAPKRQFDTDWNNFAPRFGFAYTVNAKTVVRGSYGIFYLPFIGAASGWASGINGFLSYTEMVSSLDGLSPADLLSNPFPRGILQPTAPGSGLATSLGQDFGASGRDGAIDRGNRVGYSQQWNFNVQRELPGNLSVEAAYVGNKGTKLTDGPLGHQLNQLTVEQLALGTQLQRLVPNPFRNIVSVGPLAQPTVTQGQLLRAYPQFLGLYNFRPASGSSIYHAFQLRADKRFSSGLTLLFSFTGGKLIEDTSQTVGFLGASPTHQDVYNRRASRSVASQDISRRLVLSFIYDLPFGRGKALAGNLPRFADVLFGNWQVNGIATFSTGIPLALTNAQNNSQSYSAVQLPNVSGSPVLEDGRSTDEKLARWFDTTVFSQPAPFTFGNTGRVLPNVRMDGIRSLDFSLFKNFPIDESRRVEFRGEFFNLTNTPRFGLPGQALGNAQFGVVNGQANGPRQVQLGLKVYF